MAMDESADAGRPLRLALVGCGWFAVRAHLPALEKLERTSTKALGFRVCLYALCSRSAANVERARKRLVSAYSRFISKTCCAQRARASTVGTEGAACDTLSRGTGGMQVGQDQARRREDLC